MKISAHPIWACKRGSKTVFGGAKFSPLCSFSWPIACILQDITLNLFWIQSRSLRQAVAWVDPESWSWKSAKKCCNSWFATWFRGFTLHSLYAPWWNEWNLIWISLLVKERRCISKCWYLNERQLLRKSLSTIYLKRRLLFAWNSHIQEASPNWVPRFHYKVLPLN